MELPNKAKIAIWGVLVGFFSVLLGQRYNSIIVGAPSATDIAILVIWVSLIAGAVFREVDFFGVRLKSEIDKIRTDVKEQIINLRSEIQNTINMKAEVSPHFYFPTPSTDLELQNLEKTIKPIFEETLKEHGIDKPIPIPEELDVPTDTVFLFKVRYALDKELVRITNRWWTPPEERRYLSPLRAAIKLADRGVIVPASLELIREVFAICSSAIHGEDVTEASVKFVKGASSTLLPYLKSIEVQPPAWLPRDTSQWLRKPRDWKTPPEE